MNLKVLIEEIAIKKMSGHNQHWDHFSPGLWERSETPQVDFFRNFIRGVDDFFISHLRIIDNFIRRFFELHNFLIFFLSDIMFFPFKFGLKGNFKFRLWWAKFGVIKKGTWIYFQKVTILKHITIKISLCNFFFKIQHVQVWRQQRKRPCRRGRSWPRRSRARATPSWRGCVPGTKSGH